MKCYMQIYITKKECGKLVNRKDKKVWNLSKRQTNKNGHMGELWLCVALTAVKSVIFSIFTVFLPNLILKKKIKLAYSLSDRTSHDTCLNANKETLSSLKVLTFWERRSSSSSLYSLHHSLTNHLQALTFLFRLWRKPNITWERHLFHLILAASVVGF